MSLDGSTFDVADDPALEAAFCKASIVSTTIEMPPSPVGQAMADFLVTVCGEMIFRMTSQRSGGAFYPSGRCYSKKQKAAPE